MTCQNTNEGLFVKERRLWVPWQGGISVYQHSFSHPSMPHATQTNNIVPLMTQSVTSEICKDARWHLTLITC
jgi:hypothetical protein